MENDNLIEVTREPDEDALVAAKRAATEAGTSLDGNLRWYGALGPSFREIGTKDGRIVRVREPK